MDAPQQEVCHADDRVNDRRGHAEAIAVTEMILPLGRTTGTNLNTSALQRAAPTGQRDHASVARHYRVRCDSARDGGRFLAGAIV